MRNRRFIGTLAAAVLVVVAAVFGGLALADIDGTKRETTRTSEAPASTATKAPQATTTARATAVPATPTPAAAQSRPGLSDLPSALRQQVENGARMTREQLEELADRRSNAVKAGTITRLRGNELTLRTFEGSTFTTTITGKTDIRLGARQLKRNDLKVGDSVFVISMDGGKTAFSISSFGELASIP